MEFKIIDLIIDGFLLYKHIYCTLIIVVFSLILVCFLYYADYITYTVVYTILPILHCTPTNTDPPTL